MVTKTVTVSNAAQLNAALKAATGGETILLNAIAGGDYGDVKINSYKPASEVVIASAGPERAVLKSIYMQWSENFTFSNIEVSRPIAAGASQDTTAVYIQGSAHIDIVDSYLHGSLNQNSWDDARGVRVISSNDIQFDNNILTEFKIAMSLEKSNAISVSNNELFEMREGINLFDVDHALIDHNLIHTIKPNLALGDHADAIQVFTATTNPASTDLTISNNAILEGSGGYAHGIYIQSERMASGIKHSNILVENNLYSGTALQGITLNGVTGAIVQGNTVVAAPGSTFDTSIEVLNSSLVVVTNNIATNFTNSKSTSTFFFNNIDVHIGGANDEYEISRVLANPLVDGTADVHNFALKADGLGPIYGAGFDVARYDARSSYQYYDDLTLELHNGRYLNHIV